MMALTRSGRHGTHCWSAKHKDGVEGSGEDANVEANVPAPNDKGCLALAVLNHVAGCMLQV
jgi:hypothetical protein